MSNNIYQGHKHLLSDIIGLSATTSTGENTGDGSPGITNLVIVKPNSGIIKDNLGLYLDYLDPNAIVGYSYQPARSDHRHNEILSTPGSGNLYLTNTDGIYTIGLKDTITNTIFDNSNKYYVNDNDLTIQGTLYDTAIAKFSNVLISENTERKYFFPDASGVLMITSRLSDGSLDPRIGQLPPDTPIITNISSSSTTEFSRVYTTTTISINFEVPEQYPRNLYGFTIYYKKESDPLFTSKFFQYDGDLTAESFVDFDCVLEGLVSGVQYTFKLKAMNALFIPSATYSPEYTHIIAKDNIPPSIPTNLKITRLGDTYFNISWDRNLEEDLMEYRLYYGTTSSFIPKDDDPGLNIIYRGIANSYTYNVDIFANTVHYYKLVAIDFSGNRSDIQSALIAMDDLVRLATPVITSANFTTGVSNTGLSYIEVTFSDSVVRTNTSFNNYRFKFEYDIDKDGTYDSTHTQILDGTSSKLKRNDTALGGANFKISIAAVDVLGNESIYSYATSGLVAKDTTPPALPTGLSILGKFNSVDLSWTDPTDKDLLQINIYRNTTNNSSTSRLIASVLAGSGSYSDTYNISIDNTYYYWLTSVDASKNESAKTSVISAQPILLYPSDLDSSARADFVVKDSIFSFTAGGSTTLGWTAGSIIRNGTSYTLSSGSITSANSKYVVATLSGSTATISLLSLTSSVASLTSNQIIIAFTSTDVLSSGNYACYVRQSNSMAIEGAIIRDATITNAKIQELDAAKITSNTILSNTIKVQPAGTTQTYSLAEISQWAKQATDVIEDWFMETDPVSEWISAGGTVPYLDHHGDRWYNEAAQDGEKLKGWNGFYSTTGRWEIITDQISLNLMAAAANAQDTADGKRRVFTTQPYTPYDIGDLWVTTEIANNTTVMKSCTFARSNIESFNTSDWALSSTVGAPDGTYISTYLSQTIADWSNNPAARINEASTTIDPGKILISGGTVLSDWRQGSDLTKIAGGSISANTITANKLTVGNRGISVSGIYFQAITGNKIAWSAGSIQYTNDAGTSTTVSITQNLTGISWSSGIVYIYWVQGATTLSNTTTFSTANGSNNVILATYAGGTSLVANYGGTIVDGSKITTGTITATQIAASTITGTQISADTITANHLQAESITTSKIKAGAITADKLEVGIKVRTRDLLNQTMPLSAYIKEKTGTNSITVALISNSGVTGDGYARITFPYV